MSSSGEESGGKYSIKPNSMLGKAKLKALAKAREAKAPKRRQRLDYDAEDVLPSDEWRTRSSVDSIKRLESTSLVDLDAWNHSGLFHSPCDYLGQTATILLVGLLPSSQSSQSSCPDSTLNTVSSRIVLRSQEHPFLVLSMRWCSFTWSGYRCRLFCWNTMLTFMSLHEPSLWMK